MIVHGRDFTLLLYKLYENIGNELTNDTAALHIIDQRGVLQ